MARIDAGMHRAAEGVGMVMEKTFPNVLILSGEIPQMKDAGAILLHRLFAGHREDRLFVIGPQPHPDAELLDCPYKRLGMPLRRLERTRFSIHKRSLAALGLVPLPSHRKIMRLLGDFAPDVIVCVMANTPWVRVAERTARKLGVRLVLIVHDLNEEFEKVFPWAREGLFAQNRAVYRAAARRLCVSPEMVGFLQQRYGASGEVMYPNRSEWLQPRVAEMSLMLRAEGGPSSAPAPLTLGYAGSVAYGYGEELVRLIGVLRGAGVRLRMFSPRPTGILDALNHAKDVVEICGYRPAEEMWREIQKTCDAVILPYSNPAGSQELLYHTHFPSKLTEYVALGLPVVVAGPDFATGVRWALPEKWKSGRAEKPKDGSSAFQHFNVSDVPRLCPNGAVPCPDRETLAVVLKRLREDGALRCELARRTVEAGRRDFDPVVIRERFWDVLRGGGA